MVAALASGSSFAHAQTVSGPQAGSSTAQSETQQGATKDIVVTGIRGSLQAAQDVKRRASSVVEAITSQDLGKFADSKISDAIARLPGISIARNIRGVEGGDTITIRGLGAGYVTSTVNGRELLGNPNFFGGGARQFDFGSVPSEVLSGVVVYKTATASLPEPGLGGQVDLRTLRPLDYRTHGNRQIFGTLSASGFYDENAKHVDPRISGLIGGKFFNGTLGVYLAGTYSRETSKRAQYLTYSDAFSFNVANASGGSTPVKNALVPWGFDRFDVDATFIRKAYSGALQWQPSKNFEVTADFLKSTFDANQDDNRLYYEVDSVFGLTPQTTVNAGAIVLGGGDTPSAVFYDTRGLNAGSGISVAYAAHQRIRNHNEFYTAGLNGTLKNDDNTTAVTVDFVHGGLAYRTTFRTPYAQGVSGETVFDNRGRSPTFNLLFPNGGSLNNPSNYTGFGFLEFFEKQASAKRNEAKMEFRHSFSDSLTLRVGGRYEDTRYQFVSMNFRGSTSATSLQNFFVPGATGSLIYLDQPALVVSESGFCASNPQFCNQSNFGRGSFTGAFPTTATGKADDVFDLNPGESYRIKERNLAAYIQADFKASLFGVPLSGNVGLRAVNIKETASAFQGQQSKIGFTSAPIVPGSAKVQLVTDSSARWNYLPSVNLTISPEPNINLRLGFSKTVSFADYVSLAPSGTATLILPTPQGSAQPNVATVGNTRLKPTSATNYDITGEYYTRYGGSFVASLFYKDVRDLLTGLTLLGQTIPGQGSTLFNVSTTVNGSTGYSRGFEIGTNQPFTFLPSPFDGFGIQANYTYVDSANTANGRTASFAGTSKHNVTASAYYEKGGFSGRLAYVYRTRYFVGRVGVFDQFVDPTRFLDGSLSYKFNRNFEVIATGTNLLGESQSIRYDKTGVLYQFNELPRSYRLGVRLSL